MNPIIDVLQQADVSQEKIVEVFEALTQNPMMAMAVIQNLGIPSDKLQAIIGLVMTNPGLIEEAVNELGLDFSKVEEAKAKLSQATQGE